MSKGKIVAAFVAVLVCVALVPLSLHAKGMIVRASIAYPKAFGTTTGKRFGTLKPEPASLEWCLREPSARTRTHFRTALRAGDDTARKSLYVALFFANSGIASEDVLQFARKALKEGGREEGQLMRLAALHWLRSIDVEGADPERSGSEAYCSGLSERLEELP